MTIVITDDDVRRLLSMEECIEAMRVAFADFAEGRAANMPRMRYSVDTATPDKRYLANIQAGAVPSYGVAAVRAGPCTGGRGSGAACTGCSRPRPSRPASGLGVVVVAGAPGRRPGRHSRRPSPRSGLPGG